MARHETLVAIGTVAQLVEQWLVGVQRPREARSLESHMSQVRVLPVLLGSNADNSLVPHAIGQRGHLARQSWSLPCRGINGDLGAAIASA